MQKEIRRLGIYLHQRIHIAPTHHLGLQPAVLHPPHAHLPFHPELPNRDILIGRDLGLKRQPIQGVDQVVQQPRGDHARRVVHKGSSGVVVEGEPQAGEVQGVQRGETGWEKRLVEGLDFAPDVISRSGEVGGEREGHGHAGDVVPAVELVEADGGRERPFALDGGEEIGNHAQGFGRVFVVELGGGEEEAGEGGERGVERGAEGVDAVSEFGGEREEGWRGHGVVSGDRVCKGCRVEL